MPGAATRSPHREALVPGAATRSRRREALVSGANSSSRRREALVSAANSTSRRRDRLAPSSGNRSRRFEAHLHAAQELPGKSGPIYRVKEAFRILRIAFATDFSPPSRFAGDFRCATSLCMNSDGVCRAKISSRTRKDRFSRGNGHPADKSDSWRPARCVSPSRRAMSPPESATWGFLNRSCRQRGPPPCENLAWSGVARWPRNLCNPVRWWKARADPENGRGRMAEAHRAGSASR